MYQHHEERYLDLIVLRLVEFDPTLPYPNARELAERIYELHSREMHCIFRCLWPDNHDPLNLYD